jgi:ech hydrogenase subunit A
MELNPGHTFEMAVVVLDLILLLYFLYQGFKALSWQVIVLSLGQLAPAAYFEFVLGAPTVETILVVDRLSILMTLIINVIGSIVLVYALGYMEEHESHQDGGSRQNLFFFYLVLLLGAMNGLVYSNSLYWLYFFWEVTTLCCYELIRYEGTQEATENGLRALWMGLVGGVAMIAAMYAAKIGYGTIAVDELLAAIPSRYLYLVFALMAIAAFTKSAQLPFQSWLIGAMVAPTPVSALLHSSTMVNAGVYLVLRMAPAIQGTYLTYGIAFIGIFSFMITAIIALSQKLSKKILAYSTIGNLGLIIFCAAMNTPLSYSAATILLVFHSMSKGLLFMCAGVIENRLHTRQIEDWKGLIGRLPVTAAITMVGMVSMFLPLFGVLLGKWAAIGITATAPLFLSIVMIAMMVIGSSATTLFWAKWLGHFAITPMSGAEPTEENLPAAYKISLYSLLGLDIAASLGSGLVLDRVVAPIVSLNYGEVWDTSILVLSSQVGAFMILPLWGALAAVFIVGGLLYRSKGGVVKPPYMSGENVEGEPEAFRSTADGVVKYQIAGMFFDPEITEARWVPYSTLAGVFLNMILLALVIL